MAFIHGIVGDEMSGLGDFDYMRGSKSGPLGFSTDVPLPIFPPKSVYGLFTLGMANTTAGALSIGNTFYANGWWKPHYTASANAFSFDQQNNFRNCIIGVTQSGSDYFFSMSSPVSGFVGSTPIRMDVWQYLQIEILMNASGFVRIYSDFELVYEYIGNTLATFLGFPSNFYTFESLNNGDLFYDLYISDNSGLYNNTLPVKKLTHFLGKPTADGQSIWLPGPGPNAYNMINSALGNPDFGNLVAGLALGDVNDVQNSASPFASNGVAAISSYNRFYTPGAKVVDVGLAGALDISESLPGGGIDLYTIFERKSDGSRFSDSEAASIHATVKVNLLSGAPPQYLYNAQVHIWAELKLGANGPYRFMRNHRRRHDGD